jgi:polyisoprenyl-teichoic acid--peptidoglycan teichoic acid transferase
MKIFRLVIYVVAAVIVIVAVAACRATPTPTSLPPAPPPTATTISTPTTEPTQPTGVCGQQGSITVLIMGESAPEDQSERGASYIRLARVDYGARVVRVLALPPYLWVNTPALSTTAQIEAIELTHVYREALQIPSGRDRAKIAYAADITAQTIDDNFDLAPDHTVVLRQGAFVEMIDALGGLSIDLPEDVDGSPCGLGTYSAGPQVLDGQRVLDYVSIYPAVGDEEPIELERFKRQRQVLRAIHAQVISIKTLLHSPDLIRRYHQYVVTDLGLNHLLALACLLQEPGLSVEYLELTPDLFTPGEGKILFPKTDEIIQYIETEFVQ